MLCDPLDLCSSPEQGLSFVLDNQGCGFKGWRRREPITNAARVTVEQPRFGTKHESATKVFLCYHNNYSYPLKNQLEAIGFYNTTSEKPPSRK
jgi:hypothetical protein